MNDCPARRSRWRPVYVGLGSNLGDPLAYIGAAFQALENIPASLLVARSRIYRSAPMGPPDQPDYVNAVVAMLTKLEAHAMLDQLQAIELQHGRDRSGERWGPRTLDLDLLVFGGQVLADDRLTIPHPGIRERNFVLLPLMDIAPQLHIPGVGSVARLAANLPIDLPALSLLESSSP